MDDDELRDLQDPAAWDYEHAQVLPPVADAGAVVAVRFAADEFDRLAMHAAEANMTLAGFVRDVVLERMAQRAVR